MLPISVCIISKNEENFIEECLRRLSSYDWQIIVVDTGSTDKTIEIAKKYTPNVYHFDWINDFSAAKNYAVSLASNDYILTVDCDEYLVPDENTDNVIAHLIEMAAPNKIGMVHRLNPTAETSCDESSVSDSAEPPVIVHDYPARFFHREYAHYQGSIHEQLTALDGTSPEFISIPLSFYHEGYRSGSIKKAKAARNIALLEAELENNGLDAYILFQLGQSYFGLSDYLHALPYFEEALTMEVNEQEPYVQTLVESYGYCLLYLHQFTKALGLESIYSVFSKQADFVFLMGLIYMNNAKFDAAIAEFLKAASMTDYSVEGVNSYKAYYNIGVIYECLGCKEKALKYYLKCGAYSPALVRIDCMGEKRE